jgi:hypothetical protein
VEVETSLAAESLERRAIVGERSSSLRVEYSNMTLGGSSVDRGYPPPDVAPEVDAAEPAGRRSFVETPGFHPQRLCIGRKQPFPGIRKIEPSVLRSIEENRPIVCFGCGNFRGPAPKQQLFCTRAARAQVVSKILSHLNLPLSPELLAEECTVVNDVADQMPGWVLGAAPESSDEEARGPPAG